MPRSKRVLDLIVASLGLVILSPIMLLLAVLVRFLVGAPAIFRQLRPGYKEEPFYLCKFRTMTDARDTSGRFLPDGDRLTPFGRFLRSSSLDELPELFNILRGEMSLVGPRPLLMEYLPLYSPEQRRRHDVVPGVTGWAQVHGRNALNWPARFALDVWYVDHWSFWLDLRIALMTLWKVVIREGINQPGQATTEYFTGKEH
jgi:lipopolysaccharide/colanic/teichoic acid biosynthesis glycosyltransferase